MFVRRTPKISGPNSIAALETVVINGTEQAVLIRGEDKDNPLLLFLHGGPGSAQIGFARRYLQGLERDFTVVNWDQRGSGLSYSAKVPEQSMTIEQFIQDTRALAELLLQRFGQRRLFLVGHSWGTVLGTLVAARYPDLIHAYVGMGQVVCMEENEAVSYRYTMEMARKHSHAGAIRDLERIGPPPYANLSALGVQRRWLLRFGGTMHKGNPIWLVLKGLLQSTEYKLVDMVRWVQGNSFTIKHLWPEVMRVNLPVQVPALECPVYFVLGRHDYQTPHELAAAYFEKLKAPAKELIWFEQSAHLLVFEEPETFARTMRKVLADQRYSVEGTLRRAEGGA